MIGARLCGIRPRPHRNARARSTASPTRCSSREGPPLGGVVIVHGAGSRKENHFDFARAARAAGLAAVVYDQRGHGESDGPLDDRLVDDVLRDADAAARRAGRRARLEHGRLRGDPRGDGACRRRRSWRSARRAPSTCCAACGQATGSGTPTCASVEAFLDGHDLLWEVRALDAPLHAPARRGRRATSR